MSVWYEPLVILSPEIIGLTGLIILSVKWKDKLPQPPKTTKNKIRSRDENT